MELQRLNRSDPEKIFMVFKNSYASASLTNGQATIIDYATDADGVGITKPTATFAVKALHNGAAFAGIVAETIAAGSYGLVQVYGYHSAVRVRSWTGGVPVIAAGTALACVNTAFCLESYINYPLATSSLTQVNVRFAGFALAAQASWTTKAIACFIKAL